MKTTIYWVILSEIFNSFALRSNTENPANMKQTLSVANNYKSIFLQRSKRFLIFEKGASVTFQANMAKAILKPSPRGLNWIAEYTLTYELPTGLYLFQTKKTKVTTESSPHSIFSPNHVLIPYSHSYSQYLTTKSYPIKRKHERMRPKKCLRQSLYDTYRGNYTKLCLRRFKRYEVRSVNLTKLPVSQRIFYDLIEKLSLLHGFLPRYCFMRTLCESSQLLLPYGQSLLHDIIHIFIRYTKPWAFYNKIFGRSLRQRYSIDECAKLYGPYCRISWLRFFTNAVYGNDGSRSVDFMRR